jgi:hypothetical protein
MPRKHFLFPSALVALMIWAAASYADWFLHVPYVTVEKGYGIRVRTPFVDVQVPAYGPRPTPLSPQEGLPPPAPFAGPPPAAAGEPPFPPGPPASPQPGPAPATIPPPAPRALTPGEFAASFKPGPGNYEVVLLHPRSGQPVQVNFALPPGEPRKVHVSRLHLIFDYGRQEVTIRFLLGGRVRISYE